MIAWVQANWSMVLTMLFGLSEVLALVPGIKSNSVFQLIFNGLQSLVNKVQPPAPPAA